MMNKLLADKHVDYQITSFLILNHLSTHYFMSGLEFYLQAAFFYRLIVPGSCSQLGYSYQIAMLSNLKTLQLFFLIGVSNKCIIEALHTTSNIVLFL